MLLCHHHRVCSNVSYNIYDAPHDHNSHGEYMKIINVMCCNPMFWMSLIVHFIYIVLWATPMTPMLKSIDHYIQWWCVYNYTFTFPTLPWWRHQMETISTLLNICAGNPPVTGEFAAQRPLTGALMFSLICAWIHGWVNNGEAGGLRRHRALQWLQCGSLSQNNALYFGYLLSLNV